jgi:hypothetical protein
LKAIIEEQEAQSSVRPVAQEKRAQAAGVVSVQAQPKPKMATALSTVDGYPTCLELAAEFIARG